MSGFQRQKEKSSFLHLNDLSQASPFYQSSTVNLKEQANKYTSPLGPRSLASSPQRSLSSFSQVRLDNLVKEKQWDEIEDFLLEELRDGYFDAMFAKPEPDFRSDPTNEDNRITENNTNVPKRLASQIHTTVKNDIHVLSTRFLEDASHNMISILKFSITFFVAFIICAIHPSGSWLGHRYRYFLPIAAVIHHPVRNVGIQLEISILSISGAAFGLGWASLAWYISTATHPVASHQGAILFQSLFMALLFSTFVRELYRRLNYFFNSFSVAIIFTHTVQLVNNKHDLHWKLYWDFGLSYLFGILLSCFICAVVFPQTGNSSLVREYRKSLFACRDFLVSLIDKENVANVDRKDKHQKNMIQQLNVGLAQEYREISAQISFSKYDRIKLKTLRNSLTALVSPLRVIPVNSELLDEAYLTKLYDALEKSALSKGQSLANSQANTGASTPLGKHFASGSMTKLSNRILKGDFSQKDIYLSILRSSFSKDIFSLLIEMITVLESLANILDMVNQNKNENIEKTLTELNARLKHRIYKLDMCYRNFTSSSYFGPDILKDTACVDCFLFLRYIRNSAKGLVTVIDDCEKLLEDVHWRLLLPNYPLDRALTRLSKQCELDEGAGNVLHYFETKKDVDEIFERLYNAYTSRHKYNKDEKNEKLGATIRAMDHTDFNFHSTKNKWRYSLWRFTTILSGTEMKWSIKVVFIMVFLCIPAWLPESYHWYQEFQCWWCPMIFYLLVHRRYSGSWSSPVRRVGYALLGIFLGWAANQARHFSSPYVICTFAAILVVPISLNFLVYKNTKSSMTSLLCFAVICLEPYSKGDDNHNTSKIWKNTWITGLALLIGISLSIPINWVVWSFKARVELRISMSSLLAHLSQSYQTVSDRYLYRDANDEPTDLALALAHIREVRLTQSITAIRELLDKASVEPKFISNFSTVKYNSLINSCSFLLEKIIEARISGTYFEIWEQDNDKEVSRALMSLRRDSVASVVFVFYILSNCFRSKNKIPRYLPNPILSRKKLYDMIAKFEAIGKMKATGENKFNQAKGINNNDDTLEKMMFKKHLQVDSSANSSNQYIDYEQYHWTEVHGIAFARAYTDVAEAVHDVVKRCKDILGEEFY